MDKKKRFLLAVISNILLATIIIVTGVFALFPTENYIVVNGKVFEPIYHGSRERAEISLSINVYENTKIVNKILDVLKEKNAAATFFIGGCWADDNEETLKRIVEEGHELGNHGYFHKDHSKLDLAGNTTEIKLTSVVCEALCGYKIKLFAPPSGSFGRNTLIACEKMGLRCIMWSKDTIDWRDKDKDVCYKRATKNLENGDIILMHPFEHTLKALPDIIDYIYKSSFKLVTVGENVK